ncbi:MAG: N-acetyl-gamma-glutamyl-phosphate reductase [Anaerolineaceae bacterium]|nr:N-acetyl-gamma-glutamyl-phosphate reductase [Anaerolineaceae bacterium]
MIKATIIGGSGYAGGELLRLLIAHPQVEVSQVTSSSQLGRFVYQIHPNLRKQTSLKFTSPDSLESADIVFLALPHGKAQERINEFVTLYPKIIDLSADFRLRSSQTYSQWYGKEHKSPLWLDKFIYGLPELHREEIRTANFVSGVGCNATASNLALYPLIQGKLINEDHDTIIELKVGSSEGGARENPGSHHPERSQIVRTYAPFNHRHQAEVMQESGLKNISMTISSVDMVRGALATVHTHINPGVTKADVWKAYRKASAENHFIRVVKESRGIYRFPEPKIVAGSNFADIGFELDIDNCRLLSICAIDNLMKGASGSAVQSMNLMFGLEETMGLEFPGLHPI